MMLKHDADYDDCQHRQLAIPLESSRETARMGTSLTAQGLRPKRNALSCKRRKLLNARAMFCFVAMDS